MIKIGQGRRTVRSGAPIGRPRVGHRFAGFGNESPSPLGRRGCGRSSLEHSSFTHFLLSLSLSLSSWFPRDVEIRSFLWRGGGTRLYVGRLSRRVRSRDLEDAFGKYGRVRGVDMKYDFAFVDFSEHRDADDARHYLNGRELGGSRITVEFARGASRGGGGGGGGGSSREYLGRGPPPGTGRCYNCGHDGHWARDCKSGDWRNKCYKCGERGHIERDCRNSTRVSSRYDDREGSRSESRSRSRERDGEHRSGSYRKERSDSRSPPRRGGGGRSRSPSPRKGGADNRLSHRKASVSRSPVRRRADGTPPPKREDSRSPIKRAESGSSPRSGGSISPPRQRRRAASPLEPDVKRSSPSLSPRRSRSRSPMENGRSVSPSPPPPPRNMSRSRSQSRSPIRDGALSDDDDDAVDLPRSPNGIERSPTRSDD